MIHRKRSRAFHNMARRAAKGLPVPEYGYEIPSRGSLVEEARASLLAASYFPANHPKLGKPLFRFLLSAPGRFVVGAAFFPRHVLQASYEKLKRRLKNGSSASADPRQARRS